MRKLNTADLFRAARAVKASGLRGELTKYIAMLSNGSGELDAEKIGIDTILMVIELFAERNSENAIYEVLSGPFEMEPAEIAAMELEPLMEMLGELAADGGLKAFFSHLSAILQKG